MDFGRGDGIWRRVEPGRGVIVKIVAANVAVFLLQLVLMRTSFTDLLALHPRLVLTRGYIWQIISYMFLHGGVFHLAINMFIIWMFGRTLEDIWGSRRFLRFYFACGLGGAALSFVFALNTAVIGASAAAYGILLAYGVLFPNQQLLLWFFLPIRARTLVIALILIELFEGFSVNDGTAHFAHLGGMAAALIFLRREYQLRRFWAYIRGLAPGLPSWIRTGRGGSRGGDSGKVDSILDKIADKGYENLTEAERRILERYSEDRPDR
ncbi:MAG: rhomboid family intramembrane serine protease [Candidatus Krumholzibacteria bacterium]|nr:rhomboid family intramembrane serine protease [Candidatus Krumholzibacteria bacterium]